MPEQHFFLGTLSAAQAGNWDICKANGLWGAGSSSHAKHAARHVQAGDLLFVWRSKEGLFAVAEFMAPAHHVENTSVVPWPTPERYLNTFRIRPIRELAVPLGDVFENHRSLVFGVRTHQVQSGLIKIERDQAAAMASALGVSLDGEGPEQPATSKRGAAEDPDLVDQSSSAIREEAVSADRPSGVTYLHPATPVVGAMLELWRTTQEAASGAGALLVVGDEAQRHEYEAELSHEPFASVANRFRFLTPEQLAAELRAQLG